MYISENIFRSLFELCHCIFRVWHFASHEIGLWQSIIVNPLVLLSSKTRTSCPRRALTRICKFITFNTLRSFMSSFNLTTSGKLSSIGLICLDNVVYTK